MGGGGPLRLPEAEPDPVVVPWGSSAPATSSEESAQKRAEISSSSALSGSGKPSDSGAARCGASEEEEPDERDDCPGSVLAFALGPRAVEEVAGRLRGAMGESTWCAANCF